MMIIFKKFVPLSLEISRRDPSDFDSIGQWPMHLHFQNKPRNLFNTVNGKSLTGYVTTWISVLVSPLSPPSLSLSLSLSLYIYIYIYLFVLTMTVLTEFQKDF